MNVALRRVHAGLDGLRPSRARKRVNEAPARGAAYSVPALAESYAQVPFTQRVLVGHGAKPQWPLGSHACTMPPEH